MGQSVSAVLGIRFWSSVAKKCKKFLSRSACWAFGTQEERGQSQCRGSLQIVTTHYKQNSLVSWKWKQRFMDSTLWGLVVYKCYLLVLHVTHVIKSVSSSTEHPLLQRESQETLKAWSMKKSALRLIKTYAHISIYVISKCKQPRRQHCIASNLEFNKNVSQKKCEKLLSRRCQRNVPLTTLNGHWLGTAVQSNEIQ